MAQKTGININLISIERLTQMDSREKIRFILNEVKHGNVLVLERGLTATEEAELIKTTMTNIDQDTFIGIEMQSYSQEDIRKGNWLSKLLRRKQPPRMSVIGPADLLRTIHKDGNMIQAMILTRETIVGGEGKQKGIPASIEGAKGQGHTSTQGARHNRPPPPKSKVKPSDSKKEVDIPKEKKNPEGK